MVERIYLEADKPLAVEINLQPEWMGYSHKRLYNNSNLYQLMVAYIFKDVQNRPSKKLTDSIRNIPKILNKNSYRNVEISSADIDLADKYLPRWDDDDFSEYINQFLDILEKQSILTLIKELTTDEYLAEEFLTDNTRKRITGFRVKDLMNNRKMNEIKNYIQESDIEDSTLMDKIEDGVPLVYDILEDYVKEEEDSIIIDTTSYIDKLTQGAGLGSIKRNFKFRAVKESDKVNITSGTQQSKRLVYLRVNDDSLEINGFLGDMKFTGENQIEDAHEHFINLDFKNAMLDLLDRNKSNRIKEIVLNVLTVGQDLGANTKGSLLVGKLHINYEYQKNYQKLESFTKKIEEIRNPDAERDKQIDRNVEEFHQEIEDYNLAQRAFKDLENNPNDTNARIILNRLEDEYDKEWIRFVSDATMEEYQEWQDDLVPDEEVEIEVAADIPLIYLDEVYLDKEYSLDFKQSKLRLGKKPKGEISMETGEGEERDLQSKQVDDNKDLNRLKAAYVSLSRRVENYG
tara:strand:+ start:27926 stop:29473 length:1548 start_codon:yes stop_codon:yes gene_type:complete